jgi:anhydro-N-acetylmuramic acid kinase
MTDFYIGLISGTSMDGIDAALVSFDHSSVSFSRTHQFPYPADLRRSLLRAIREPQNCTVDDVGELDQRVGECFRDAANAIVADANIDPTAIRAIGSHGQTLRHLPGGPHPFTMQIGNPSVVAAGTGITTVADFRRADVALGGQGAPLTPVFHEWLFRKPGINRVVLNIGGIGNITVLPGGSADAIGFDTGPGNTLLDTWIEKHRGESYDTDGAWASSGNADEGLLAQLLADPYFQLAHPKSTGFEYFNLDWLDKTGVAGLAAVDVQATLCELTAASIAMAVHAVAPGTAEVFVCGGGVHNGALMQALATAMPNSQLASTETVGLDPDWVEAAAFAWLAMRTLHGLPGNLPAVTGASRSAILGAVYPA